MITRCKHGLLMDQTINSCGPCKELIEVQRQMLVWEAEQDAERETLIAGLYLSER